jgi:hypothetical protein
MILQLIILVIGLLILYTFLRLNKENNSNSKEHFDPFPIQIQEKNHKRNFIENFMAYPNKQKYCPNLYKYKTKFWSKLPQKYGKGLYGKFCCVSCYYKISKKIICNKNQGKYKICRITKTDLDNLQEYYDSNRLKMDFKFNKVDIEKYIGKKVLKIKNNDIYYPIQILKTKKDMDNTDIINKKDYRTDFKCPEKKISKTTSSLYSPT